MSLKYKSSLIQEVWSRSSLLVLIKLVVKLMNVTTIAHTQRVKMITLVQSHKSIIQLKNNSNIIKIANTVLLQEWDWANIIYLVSKYILSKIKMSVNVFGKLL